VVDYTKFVTVESKEIYKGVEVLTATSGYSARLPDELKKYGSLLFAFWNGCCLASLPETEQHYILTGAGANVYIVSKGVWFFHQIIKTSTFLKSTPTGKTSLLLEKKVGEGCGCGRAQQYAGPFDLVEIPLSVSAVCVWVLATGTEQRVALQTEI